MPKNNQYSLEQKLTAAKAYLNGDSAINIASNLGMKTGGSLTITDWAHKYQANGMAALKSRKHNQHYSKAFKTNLVRIYLQGQGSYRELAIKYQLRSATQLRDWVKRYNKHIELKDYDPKLEVYMAKRRKTTQQERIKIVQDCLAHQKNYKQAATKYSCSYAQVYLWTRKYLKDGETGLTDKRGRHKKASELSELEQARREIKRLKVQLQEKDDEAELLKKAADLERKCLQDDLKHRE